LQSKENVLTLGFVVQVLYKLTAGGLDQLKLIVSLLFKPPHLLLLLELLAQLVLGFSQLLLGLLNLGFARFDGLLQRSIVPQPGLDQLLLEVGGFIPLSLQVTLMLEGQLFLLG
jgi:hypothetical protein